MALRGIQGKPMGPFASNVPIQAMHELYRWTVGGEDESGSTASGMPSEGKSADQLNLARGGGGGLDLAYVIGKITRSILEDSIPVTSKGKRALCITRSSKIRMVEQVISFHPKRDFPFVKDREILVQRRVELRERRPPQDVSSGIAKLKRWRYGKSTWIKPAGHRTHFGPIRADAHIRVASKVWAFRNKQRLHVGIVEGEHRSKWGTAMNAGNSRDLPAGQETSCAWQLVSGIYLEVLPDVEI